MRNLLGTELRVIDARGIQMIEHVVRHAKMMLGGAPAMTPVQWVVGLEAVASMVLWGLQVQILLGEWRVYGIETPDEMGDVKVLCTLRDADGNDIVHPGNVGLNVVIDPDTIKNINTNVQLPAFMPEPEVLDPAGLN